MLIVIGMGLIEWNARRQAAAITRELMRPMTPKEEAQLNAEMLKLQREVDRQALVQTQRAHRAFDQLTAEPPSLRPLRAGVRCINGRRFARIEGGWRDVPNQPCR